MPRLIERCPGNGIRYQILIVNISDLSENDRELAGFFKRETLYQATLINWPGRPSLIFSSYVAPHYAAEKMPTLDEQTIDIFCEVLNNEVLDLDGVGQSAEEFRLDAEAKGAIREYLFSASPKAFVEDIACLAKVEEEGEYTYREVYAAVEKYIHKLAAANQTKAHT